MSSVDDRIVNMQFNNKQFTQGVQQSQRDLTGLDKTLANAGKASGLGKMAGAAQEVSSKFSVMQIAGVTAVATIANKVTLAAGSMLKKLTIQPLIDGFKEYTTNLESVQTIMANTGKSVGTVNKYLDQMNSYADQTIYNFSQMAKNVGTFTAAGVELPKAVSAIKGISNLAALSGSNSQQASTAMYQLSQAIAAGKVGLQDWNSVVNAGMGGKVFKNALAQTAVAMGDLSSNAVKVGTDVEVMGQSFRNSIMATPGQESWLSSDVLVTTLATLDGRFSKTAIQAGLLADGYSELEAKEMTAAKLQKARNDLAKQGIEFSEKEYDAMVKKADAAYQAATQIKTATQLFQVVQESIGSMWASAFRIILGDFKQSKELWGNVGDVVLGIVDKISGGFLGMLRVWEERGGRMKVIDGLANIFGSLIDIFGAIAKGFDDAFPDSNVSMLNRISKAFFALSEALVPSKQTIEDIGTIAEAVFSVFHFGFTIIKGITKGLAAFVGALFGATTGAGGGFLSLVASVAKVIIAFEDWLTSGSKITRFLKGIGEVAGGAIAPLVSLISSVVQVIAAIASGSTGRMIGAFHDIRNTFFGMIEAFLNGLAAVTAPIGFLSDFFSGLATSVGGLKSTLGDFYRDMNSQGGSAPTPLVTGLRTIQDIVGNIGDVFRSGFSGIGDLFSSLGDGASKAGDAMGSGLQTSFAKTGAAADKVKDKTAGIYDSISGAGAAAATASTGAVTTGAEKVGSAFEGIGGILKTIGTGIKNAFTYMVEAISGIPFPDDPIEWATVLNALISGALIKKLFFSKGLFGQLKESIQAIGEAATNSFEQLTNTLKTMQGAIKAEMIKNIAIAVALLVASLVILSYVPADKLANGMAALAATMLMAGAMMQVMMAGLKKIPVKDLVKYGVGFALVGVGMMAMATAVLILTAAVAALAFIPFDKLKQGLGAVAILMSVMTASLMLLSGQGAKVAAVGVAMALMAVAIDTMVLAVIALGVLPFDKLEQGLGAVAIGIGIMTASLLLLSGSSAKVVGAGAAMVLMATALNILIPLIVTMGLLPWDVVEQGLKAVAIGLGILVVAGYLAIGAQAGLMALSIVIIAIGAAMFLAGTGMALFAGGLALLAAVGAAAVAVITLAILAFIALLPNIAIAVAAAFVTFLQALAAAAPKIRKAMGTIITNMLGTIDDAIPKLKKTFGNLIEAGLEVIALYMSRYVLLGVQIVLAILTGLAENIPKIIDKAYEIAYAFIDGMGDRAVDLANAGADALIKMINGFADAVETKGPEIRAAVRRLGDAIAAEFRAWVADFKIPTPSLPEWMKNPSSLLPGMRRKGNTINLEYDVMARAGNSLAQQLKTALDEGAVSVGNAIAGAIALFTAGSAPGSKAVQYTTEAKAAEAAATKSATTASYLDPAATKAEEAYQKKLDKAKKIKDKKKRDKEIQEAKDTAGKRAETLRKAANKAANEAERQQTKADERYAAAQQELAYDTAMKQKDYRAAGDVRSEQGQDLADKSAALLAKAQAQQAEADRLAAKGDKKGAKKLREEALANANLAKTIAADAWTMQQDAVAMYAEARKAAAAAVRDRSASIVQQLAERDAERQWEKDFEALDGNAQGQADMLNARAKANEDKAAAARTAMQTALAEAERLADTDAEAAMAQLDEAERQAQIANSAADSAEADREKAEDLLEQAQTANNQGTTTSGAQITPSRTALEDAANAVDRYTTSMQQAEEQAGAGSSSTQFIQNNYSPEALSASQLYRQGKNLVSAAEVKMAASQG